MLRILVQVIIFMCKIFMCKIEYDSIVYMERHSTGFSKQIINRAKMGEDDLSSHCRPCTIQNITCSRLGYQGINPFLPRNP